MIVPRLEALIDAITRFNDWADPASEPYQARNPLGLRASYAHARTSLGYRIFRSAMDGYQSGLHDLKRECSGNGKRIAADASLRDLIISYHVSSASVGFVLKHLRKALNDFTLTDATPISYFTEVE